MTADSSAQAIPALLEAAAIAHSAGGAIDWTRESLTDRERRIRKLWLERRLQTELGRAELRCVALLEKYRRGSRSAQLASDFQEALIRADARSEQSEAERNAAELRDIMAELDEEG